MGKRIIISESEKKNILSLYEATNVTPPPSESVLVVKGKNPFKYPQYESARREYSNNLKDGDMFYTYNDLNYYWDSFGSMIKNQLLNKTIRISEADVIFKISDVLRVNNYPKTTIELTMSMSENSVLNPRLIITKYDASFRSSYDKYIPYLKKMIEYAQTLISEYDNFYIEKVENKTDLSTVPDEYFNIHKIQRQQTDF